MYGLAAGLGLLALARQAVSLDTITAKGSKLFTSSGSQWYIKGVAYQLTDDDPLANTNQCQLDAKLMQTLGANALRVYHVDPTANHDGCMSAFSSAGIYTFIDLDTFSTYIMQTPTSTPSWSTSQYEAYQQVMDAFQSYDNVAGFFVGNEVLTTGANSVAAPYVKAAARDMKMYRDSKGYRDIPVGYSAADIASLRPNLQNYLACGSNASESVDFFSLNAYEWCGQSSYETSGYSELQQNASGYSIPIFFSETGCNTPEPRTFGDQAAIFGDQMSGTWSGAIIYEWIQETNNYGLISYGPSAAPTATGAGVVAGYTRQGTPTPISPDFDNLSSQWATLSPSGVSMNAYSPTATPPACPSYTSGLWDVSGDVPLPTLGQAFQGSASVASATTSGASPSNNGASTGTASEASTGTASAASTGTASGASATGSSTGSSSSSGAAAQASATSGALQMPIGGFLGFLLRL